MIELLAGPFPVEAYTDDDAFLTVTYNCTKMVCSDPYQDEVRDVVFLEIKHVETLQGHAHGTNQKLQEAIDAILRSVPG